CADRRTLTNLFLELSRGSDDEPFQYLQFSEWQNSLSEDEEAAKGKEYWAKEDLSFVSVSSVFLSGNISRLAQTHEGTGPISANLLLAVWQTLLRRLTGQPIVIGNVSDGRSYELLQDAFGLLARVLPACPQPTENLRFSEVVTQLDNFQHESEEW